MLIQEKEGLISRTNEVETRDGLPKRKTGYLKRGTGYHGLPRVTM